MKNMQSPLTSVTIPVYNAGHFLTQAIESVVNQTYKNLEIICVDDVSTDETFKILKMFSKQDKRVKIYRLKKHSGVSIAANFAISHSKGRFIARMDADDLMMKTRIEKQMKFLLENTDIVAVGGQCKRIDVEGKSLGIKRFPLTHKEIVSMVFRSIPIQQSSLMINRNRLPSSFPWYNKELPIGEDYELYYKLLQYGKLANLPDTILLYREHEKGISFVSQKKTFWYIWKSRLLGITKYGYIPDLKSVINVLIQTIIALILPDKLLYPLHMWTRQFFFKVGYN